MTNLATHFVQQSLFPEPDKPQWLAYLVLNQRYPNLTYLSMDGYHCHGIADYSEGKMLYWQDSYKGGIVNWVDKTLIYVPVKDFCEMSTEEIIYTWMNVCGETEGSKLNWLNSMRNMK